MDRPSPATTPARPAVHGGVIYVGPSLTSSLFDFVVALTRSSAEQGARTR